MSRTEILQLYRQHLEISMQLINVHEKHTKIGDRILEDDTRLLEDNYAEMVHDLAEIGKKINILVGVFEDKF